MKTNPRQTRLRDLARAAAVAALAIARTPAASQTATCPIDRPTLAGPSQVRTGQQYALSWTDVLSGRVGAADYYWVERATDSAFTRSLDRLKTTRAAITLPPGPTGSQILYHRITAANSCAGAAAAPAATSNVLVTRVTNDCASPDPVSGLAASPSAPPAFTTYVVSWDIFTGGPGPGGGPPADLKYRLRRTSPDGSQRDWLAEGGSASFTDPTGTYSYEVRAEDPCGAAGSWTTPLKVVVGDVPISSLLLVSEPRPMILVSAPPALPKTSFTVRNAGNTSIAVTARPTLDTFLLEPTAFTLAPYAEQRVSVTAMMGLPVARPFHGFAEVSGGGAALKIPLDVMVAAEAADASVTWSTDGADVNAAGDALLRSITNPGRKTAAFVSSIRQPWLAVETFDGTVWDRPLAPGETRFLKIRIDRAKRPTYGTEIGTVALHTAGRSEEPPTLSVVDDGPNLPLVYAVRPSAATTRTRVLYASLPNAADVRGVGRFTGDLWLSNLDALSDIDVTLYFTPIGQGGAEPRRVDLRLARGEVRRFRNIVGKVYGYDAACAVEVSSPSATLSSTAIVANTPNIPEQTRADAASSREGLHVTAPPTSGSQYGFEMRPTRPGEGVSATDPLFVLTGLTHDPGRRRSNLILLETAGYTTTVRVKLYQSNAAPVLKDGQPHILSVEVPANGTVQINDAELFPETLPTREQWALIEFETGFNDFGRLRGSVFPFATNIDDGTQDAALAVGVSQRSLDPIPPLSSVAVFGREGAGLSAVPYGGGAAPLLFPAAHIRGAALGTSTLRPVWRTRVTLTNVNQNEQRNYQLKFVGSDGTERFSGIGALSAGTSLTFPDVLRTFAGVTEEAQLYGSVLFENVRNPDGQTWQQTWKDIDVQTETYTFDPQNEARGEFKTGMEGFTYRHGYSSYQSNLGTVQIEGAETSSRYRTNLIIQETANASCLVLVSAYLKDSVLPIATKTLAIPPYGYYSKELFRDTLGLDLTELTDVRVVVRKAEGEGVFMAFISRINKVTADPANVFLRPALAGTGR